MRLRPSSAQSSSKKNAKAPAPPPPNAKKAGGPSPSPSKISKGKEPIPPPGDPFVGSPEKPLTDFEKSCNKIYKKSIRSLSSDGWKEIASSLGITGEKVRAAIRGLTPDGLKALDSQLPPLDRLGLVDWDSLLNKSWADCMSAERLVERAKARQRGNREPKASGPVIDRDLDAPLLIADLACLPKNLTSKFAVTALRNTFYLFLEEQKRKAVMVYCKVEKTLQRSNGKGLFYQVRFTWSEQRDAGEKPSRRFECFTAFLPGEQVGDLGIVLFTGDNLGDTSQVSYPILGFETPSGPLGVLEKAKRPGAYSSVAASPAAPEKARARGEPVPKTARWEPSHLSRKVSGSSPIIPRLITVGGSAGAGSTSTGGSG